MSRIMIALTLVAGLLGAVGVGRAELDASAQGTPAADRSAHPVVGAWRWDNDPGNPADDSYAIFHADGTYVEVTTNAGTAIGAWEATGNAQAIQIDPETGALFGASDPRRDGYAIGW